MIRAATLILLLAAGPLHSQPLAWRATHPAADGELVLLGSIHVLRAEDYPLPPMVDLLYEQADILVMELDLDSIDPMAMQSQLVSAALSTDPRGLPSLVDSDLYFRTSRQAALLGVELAMLDRFEPWFVAITLSSLGIVKLGYQPEIGLEQHLIRRAQADRKEVIGLESVGDQVSVFDNLSDTEQSALLEQTLMELQSTDQMMEELITAWRTGELASLSEQLLEEFEAYPTLYQRLVSRRNESWAERLRTLVATDQRILVVVGALHLLGRDSVIELLAESGFDIDLIR